MTRTPRIAAGFTAALALLGTGFGLGYSSGIGGIGGGRVRPPPPVPPERVPAAPDRAAEPFFEILGDPDAFSRAGRLSALLSELGPETVPTVRATLEEPPPSGFGAVETVLMARFWARHDPAAAADWALGSWEGYRAAVSIPVVELFVRSDPQAAVEAIQTRGAVSGLTGESLQRAIVRGWYESGHPGLLDYIRAQGYGMRRQRAVSMLARETIRHEGPDAVIRWVRSKAPDRLAAAQNICG